MKIETLDLHGLSVEEAKEKIIKSLNWCINHDVDVLDINHGKGYHSSRNFSVIKQEIRRLLKKCDSIQAHGYKIVYGESDLPISLTFDEGHTLVVAKSLTKQYIGGKKQQEKNKIIFSTQGKKVRKKQKRLNAEKRSRRR